MKCRTRGNVGVMFARFFRPPAASFFLFGPRGTGKSTWLRDRYPEALFIDLIDPENARFYAAAPERLRQTVAASPGRRPVVIDEVQRVPELLAVVHQLVELDKGLRFVLTGSSARKLRRRGVDLLAGRALLTTMHPFMAAELGGAFSLDRALALCSTAARAGSASAACCACHAPHSCAPSSRTTHSPTSWPQSGIAEIP